jgi:hypothetical protein
MSTTQADRDEAIATFDALIASAATPEQADDRRLLKAYFTDPAARAKMVDLVWRLTNGQECPAERTRP